MTICHERTQIEGMGATTPYATFIGDDEMCKVLQKQYVNEASDSIG